MDRLRMAGSFLAVLAAVAGPSAARAETLDVKLGLWEVTTTTQRKGSPPIDTGKLTPEQRERLEAALKANEGTRTRTFRSCLTKEKRDKELFRTDEGKDNASCKHVVLANSRTLHEVKMECTGERPMTGDARFEALSPERVKGTTRMTVGMGPRSVMVDSRIAARWLGSDCGSTR